jgi:AcrR family transcriptional regulator
MKSPSTRETEGGTTAREALLYDAADYFLKHGVTDASLRSIAAGIGTSHRMLLYHFGSKERLIAEAIDAVRHAERLSLIPARQPGAGDPLDAIWAAWCRWRSEEWTQYFRFQFEVWLLALRDPESYEAFLGGVVDDWLDEFATLLTTLGFPAAKARRSATLILATMRGLHLDLFTTGDVRRADGTVRELLALIRLGFSRGELA